MVWGFGSGHLAAVDEAGDLDQGLSLEPCFMLQSPLELRQSLLRTLFYRAPVLSS